MASARQSEMQGGHLCVLALTLLVVLIFGFVVLLSRVPVGLPGSHNDGGALQSGNKASGYQFYSLLPEQTSTRHVVRAQAAVSAPVPAAVATTRDDTPRTVSAPATALAAAPPAPAPVTAPTTTAPILAAQGVVTDARRYREIPANNISEEYYFLQVGNFRHSADAERTRASMLLNGFDAVIVPGEHGHRVRLGPYFDSGRVDTARQRLRQSGINYTLIRIAPNQ